MTMPRRLLTVSTAALLTVGMAGCASSHSTEPAEVPAAAEQAGASATDIAFAQAMIPHHDQAVEMADLALDPQSQASRPVKRLARQIKRAQAPEIQQMTSWLQQWGAPTAMPGMTGSPDDHSDHSGHDMGGLTMSGMVSPEQFAELEAATGRDFDVLWLQFMIAHHEGAVAMAEQAKANGANAQVAELSDAVITSQRAEIQRMHALLSQQ